MPEPSRVFIVDDHPVVRKGLAEVISREEGLVVDGEASTAAVALDALDGRQPDIVLVDLSLPETPGFALIQEINRRWEDLPVIAITMHTSPDYLKRALQIDVQGYVLKTEPIEHFVEAIRHVLEGGFYLSREMSKYVPEIVQHPSTETKKTPLSALSEREREILQLVGEGNPPRAIAQELNLSVKTVHSHRENIKRKLDLESMTELTQFAVQWVHS